MVPAAECVRCYILYTRRGDTRGHCPLSVSCATEHGTKRTQTVETVSLLVHLCVCTSNTRHTDELTICCVLRCMSANFLMLCVHPRSFREGTTNPTVEQVYSFSETHSPNRLYAIAATVQYF